MTDSSSFAFKSNKKPPPRHSSVKSSNKLTPLSCSYKLSEDKIGSTPKTLGITRLNGTYNYKPSKFVRKRLSIPSFHVANQILMDLIQEQNELRLLDECPTNEISVEEEEEDDEDEDVEDENGEEKDMNEVDDELDDSDFEKNFDDDDDDDDDDDGMHDISPLINKNINGLNTTRLSIKIEPFQSISTPLTMTPAFMNFSDIDEDTEVAADYSPFENTTGSMSILQQSLHRSSQVNANAYREHSYSGREHSFSSIIEVSESESMSGHRLPLRTYSTHNYSYKQNDQRRNKAQKSIRIKSSIEMNLERSASELYDTELIYLRHLQHLEHYLLSPLIRTYLSNDCVSCALYKFLCEIIQVSKCFCSRLKVYVAAHQTPSIGQWFYFCCKKFGVYSHYAKMYDIFLNRYSIFKDYDPVIDEFLKSQEMNHKKVLENLSFTSLLVMPVQRLPRYILIISELIKSTKQMYDTFDPNHASLLFLELAKSEIETVSFRVNEMIRQRENRQSLQELGARFVTNSALNNKNNNKCNVQLLIRTDRVLVYEGFMFKLRRYKIRYYFHLFSDILTYSHLTKNGLFSIHRIIDLKCSKVKDLPNIKLKNNNKNKNNDNDDGESLFRFLLLNKEKSFELLCNSQQEKNNWLLLIQAAISRLEMEEKKNSNQQQQQQITTDDVQYAAYWAADSSSMQCFICFTHFSIMNRRHHCRQCGKLVCGQCSKQKRMLSLNDRKAVRVCIKCRDVIDNALTSSALNISSISRKSMSRSKSATTTRAAVMMMHTPSAINESLSMTDVSSENDNDDDGEYVDKSEMVGLEVLDCIREYHSQLHSLLEGLVRPLLDIVQNNKILAEYLKHNKLYDKKWIKNRLSIIHSQSDDNESSYSDSNVKLQQMMNTSNLVKKMRKKKKQKRKKFALNQSEMKALKIFHQFLKYQSQHKMCIHMFLILEQIFDLITQLYSELNLLIFREMPRESVITTKKETSSVSDFGAVSHEMYDNDIIQQSLISSLGDRDHARMGRLFMIYGQLFNLHVEYACRLPEVNAIILCLHGHLSEFLRSCLQNMNVNISSGVLNDLLIMPLKFPDLILIRLKSVRRNVDSSMVNCSDLDLCISQITQIVRDLNKEKTQAYHRLKLFNDVESAFDFDVDFRQRGRSAIMSDMIIKTSKHMNHSYFFYLFSNRLIYAHRKLGNIYQVKRCIFLFNINVHECSTVDNKNAHKSLQIEQIIRGKKNRCKTYRLIFDSIEKKNVWFAMLTNLSDIEKGKLIENKDDKKDLKQKISPKSRVRSYTVDTQSVFCAICHEQFRPVFNPEFTCFECSLPCCQSCIVEKFHLESPRFIAPDFIKLCIRCSFHKTAERTVNTLLV